MPTAKYVYRDDPDETILEESQDDAVMSSPQFTQPLPLRGGGRFAPSTQSSASVPSTLKRSKKARLKQLAEMMDSDESDEELSEQAFLEGLARRQREQAARMESQTQRNVGFGAEVGNDNSTSVNTGNRESQDHQRRGRENDRSRENVSKTSIRARSLSRSRSQSRTNQQNHSICTQDTTQMGNRTVDTTARDRTLLGNTTIAEHADDPLDDSMDFDKTQPWEREIALNNTHNNNGMTTPDKGDKASSGVNNPYQKQEPKPPLPKSIPKMSFEQLQQRRKSFHAENKPGWQTQAYQSSLTDLIQSFQSVEESEQTQASSQVARKRCFDAASRALARMAIVSRSGNDVMEDCNPPSPRSLPSFMSVMNVQQGNSWREGEGLDHDVFVGHSVHGKSGRTVCFVDEGEGNMEQLTMKAVKFAAGVCYEAFNAKMSRALVEAALEYLATAFACLECDLVYSMFLVSVRGRKDAENASLFDVLLELSSNDGKGETSNTISTLAFLALSRGMEATVFVARYSTSLDPAGCCAAYTSPHTASTADNERINEGGVGFLSAVGKDLGLHLENDQGVRLIRLSAISKRAYESVLDFNPMITDNSQPFYETSNQSRSNDRRGRKNDSLCIDTEVGSDDDIQCRQPSVVKDRKYAAHVEFLSSMIQIGVLSGWLGDSDSDVRVKKLCQKLFLVIETRSRLRRSTNQRSSNEPLGDSESVCSASLSLLLLALPKHQDQTANSMSFRQMGDSTGTIRDIFESPLVKRMVKLGLTMSYKVEENKDLPTKKYALNSILYVLSSLLMAGGSSLVSTALGPQLKQFLIEAIDRICQLNSNETKNGANIEVVLLVLLHLHNGCPIVVRKAMRNFFEQSTKDIDGTPAALFVGNLLQLCVHPCFSVSACASSLYRSLLNGSPLDDTPDILSDLMRLSFQCDSVISSVDSIFHSLAETTYCIEDTQAVRHLPRICTIGDVLSACPPSSDLEQVIFSTLGASFKNKTVKDVFVNILSMSKNGFDETQTLHVSAMLSIIYLLSQLISSVQFDNGINLAAILDRTGLLSIELALSQGTSADLTHRAMKHQNSLSFNEKTLALAFTRAHDSHCQEEISLRKTIANADCEIAELRDQVKAKELERTRLRKVLNDQTASYEKRLDLVRFEAKSVAKRSAEIHVQERRRAEEHALKNERLYHNEKERRLELEEKYRSIAEESCRIKQELSNVNSNTLELQHHLDNEREDKERITSVLEKEKDELKSTKEELENIKNAESELRTKLKHSEKSAQDLNAINKELVASLEENCEKLVSLATIYQRKEAEMDKYKAELRSAVTAANRNAEMAISKYEAQRNETKSLKKELECAITELNDLKEHKADVQRLRKNAPTSYINQLRNDPRIQAQPRKSRSGKENSFASRSQR